MPLQTEPFVVFGPSKSGTTWVQRLLDAHPDVRCHFQLPLFYFADGGRKLARPGQAVFSHLQSPFQELFGGEKEAAYWVRLRYFQRLRPVLEEELGAIGRRFPEANHPDLLRETLRETYRALAERFLVDVPDKKRYGVKATTDLDFFFELYPSAKVIAVIRDGRDVAVSKRFHMQRRGAFYHGDEKSAWLYLLNHFYPSRLLVRFLQKRYGLFGASWYRKYGERDMRFTPAALRKFATDWKLTVEYLDGFRQKYPEQLLWVRYEDLKEDLARELNRMFHFLGVDCDRDVLNVVVQLTDFKRMKKKASDSFFRKGLVGDWRNYFTDADLKLFNELAGDTLRRMGYE